MQVVVDHKKQFQDIFIGFPISMNNLKILRLFSLYKKAKFDGFFDLEHGSHDGIHPYINGDKDYLLLLWLMIPHKYSANVKHTFLKTLYNRHLSKGRNVVENAFGILKKLLENYW